MSDNSNHDPSSVYDRMKPIIVEQLGVNEDDVALGALFVDDLNADSLDLVELNMSLEEEFDMEVPDEDAKGITTVGSAIDYTVAHMGSGKKKPASA